MKIENHSLFPTLVKCVHNFITKEQCEDIVKYINTKKDEFKTHSSLPQNSLSSYNLQSNIIRDIQKNVDSCYYIVDDFNKILDEYSRDTGFYNSKLVNSWVNIQEKKSTLSNHNHPLSHISGVLYLKVDKDSSKLYFLNPNPFIKFTAIYEEQHNEYTYDNCKFIPGNGMLLVFPSWLSHGSNLTENNSEERIVLSFNTAI